MTADSRATADTHAQASIQVLTNRALVRHATAFVTGVPYSVLQFKETAFPAYIEQRYLELEARCTVGRTMAHVRLKNTPLWQAAVVYENRPVITALDALSRTPRYRNSMAVRFSCAMILALVQSRNVAFLDWLYTTLLEPQKEGIRLDDRLLGNRRRIDEKFILKVVERQDVVVMRWLHSRGYTFTSCVLTTASSTGNLALVRFLLDECHVECLLDAMDDAAAAGKLNIVQHLHNHPRSPGCSIDAQSQALINGYLDVLVFLYEHCNEGCSASSVDIAVQNGRFGCIQFAHNHNFVGFSYRTMSYAITHNQLEIVAFLHTHRTEGCTLESLFSAADNKYDAIVDYLVQHRPVSNRKAVIQAALKRRLVRLVLKLLYASARTSQVQQFEYGRESVLRANAIWNRIEAS